MYSDFIFSENLGYGNNVRKVLRGAVAGIEVAEDKILSNVQLQNVVVTTVQGKADLATVAPTCA